jgi:Response regulator containing CheY-like receiver, AAA-type ATPase, and DNA-binding domains
MEELLRQINETFENCISNSSDETALQLKIVKNNINTLINNYVSGGAEVVPEEINNDVVSVLNDNAKKILIIDDSSIVRNYLQKIFSDQYQIEMATDGQDAINHLNSLEDPDSLCLILLDLMMPNLDGFGVLEYLQGRNIKVPVIIISGDNTKDTINRAFQYNVIDIIEKPFDSKTIQEKISSIIDSN